VFRNIACMSQYIASILFLLPSVYQASVRSLIWFPWIHNMISTDNFTRCSTSWKRSSGDSWLDRRPSVGNRRVERTPPALLVESDLLQRPNSRSSSNDVHVDDWIDEPPYSAHIKAAAPANGWAAAAAAAADIIAAIDLSRKKTLTRRDWWKKTQIRITCRTQQRGAAANE